MAALSISGRRFPMKGAGRALAIVLILAGLVLSGSASVRAGASGWRPEPQWLEGNISTAAGRIHYYHAGSGRPVLLIHGNTASGRWFTGLLPPEGFAYYAPDLPGFGLSARTGEFTLEGYAKGAESFLDALGFDGIPLLAGHSLGGLVAARMASSAPERYGALLLSNVPFLGNSPISQDYFDRAARYGEEDALLKMSLRRVALTLADDDPAFQMMFKEARRMDPSGFTENPRILTGAGMYGSLSSFKGRIVFLGSALDEVIPPSVVRYNSMITPGSEYHELPHSGHAPMLEAPDAFSEVLKAMLTGGGIGHF